MPAVQWWCSATGLRWTWDWQAYPGVWLVVVGAAVAMHRAMRARPAGGRVLGAWSGLALLWLALDWPTGPLGTGYLASVHAVQFVVLAMIAPPLLLLAADRGRVRDALARRPWLARALGVATHPVLAAATFTVVMSVTHLPRVVDTLMRTQLGAFALDASWVLSGLLLWMPVVVAEPARAWFTPPLRMLYLFLGTQAHLLIAMWLLTARFPVYATYELAPRVTLLSALEDQQVAGGVMLLVGEPVVLAAIAIVFFRWFAASEREAADR